MRSMFPLLPVDFFHYPASSPGSLRATLAVANLKNQCDSSWTNDESIFSSGPVHRVLSVSLRRHIDLGTYRGTCCYIHRWHNFLVLKYLCR